MLLPFFVWQNKKLKSVNPEDVMFLVTEKNYTKIVLSNRTFHMVRSSLAAALKRLPANVFIRTDRAFGVSILYIDNIARDHLTIGEDVIPIGKQYYEGVIKKLHIIE
jgi:DNA-binding LytR/AlgR family response regulator